MKTSISVKELLENAIHYGHRTHRWNPKMKKYIFGVKNGVHIFDLKKTAERMKDALNFLHDIAAQNKTILLVGTKPQAAKLLHEAGVKTGMPVVNYKWICGLLTNYSTVKKRIQYLKHLKELFQTGEIEKYTKKEQTKFKKEIEKLELSLGGVADMEKLPHAVFVVDSFKDQTALKEARTLQIPTIGIVDSCADPDYTDYPIPANDDALKALQFVIGLVTESILAGKKAVAKA